jgi:hypothetical protein
MWGLAMHDVLRQRLWRHIEALPEEQLYQALDYVEFLAAKYARESIRPPASSLQKFGERLQDKMRGQGLGLRTIRGTLDAMGTADRMVSGISEAGRTLWQEVEQGLRTPSDESGAAKPRVTDGRPATPAEGGQRALPPAAGSDDPLTRI